jgi:hypothetical protein
MLPHAFAVCSSFLFRPSGRASLTSPASGFMERGHGAGAPFSGGIDPGQATLIAAEHVHDDYAYVFEAHWDLWTPDVSSGNWVLEPAPVRFIVQGEEFDEGAYQQTGHIQVDLGLDSYFLQPETDAQRPERAQRFARTWQSLWSSL